MKKHFYPDAFAFAKAFALCAIATLVINIGNKAYGQCGVSNFAATGVTQNPTTAFQTINAGSNTYVDFNCTIGNFYSFYYNPGSPGAGYVWDMTLSNASATIGYDNVNTPISDSWTGGIGCPNQVRPTSAEWYATYTGTVRVNVHSYNTGTNSCELYVSGQSSAVINYKKCTPTADPGFGIGVWNVDAYATTSLVVPNTLARYGYYVDNTSGLNFNTTNYYGAAQTPASATGWIGCPGPGFMPGENYVVRARRTNFTCGAYKFQVNRSTDSLAIYLNGVRIHTSSAAINSATIVGNANGYLLSTNDEVDIRYLAKCGNNQMSVSLVQVTPGSLNAGAIQADQTICSGSTPNPITNLTLPSGGYSSTYVGGGYTYDWRYLDNCTGTGTSTAGTGTGLVLPALTNTRCYYRQVTDGCGNQAFASPVTITVNQPSVAAVSASSSPTTICNSPGQSSTLSVAGGTLGTGASWVWYAGGCGSGSSVGTGSSISVSPTSSTTYYVRAEGPGPCATTTACVQTTVTVNDTSTAPTGIDASATTICNNGSSSVNLTVLGGALGTGASWKWYSGSCGGTAVGTGATVTVSPTVTTTYFVRAENAGPCNANTACAQVTITVNQPSVAATSAGASPSTVCNGSSSTLSVSGGTLGTGANWVWYAGGCGSGSPIGSGSSISVTPTTTTTYYVRAEGPGPCSTSTACQQVTVTVNDSSIAPTGISASDTTICNNGSSTQLTVVGGTLGTGASWKWYTGSCGGSPVGSGNSITVTPTTTTTYYVRAEGPSPCTLNTACAQLTIIVNQPSVAATSVGVSAGTICNGDSSVLTAIGGTLGTGASWVWYAGGCGSGAPVGTGVSITVMPSVTTTYYVRAEGPTPCATTTACVQGTVNIQQHSVAATIINGNSSSCVSGSTSLSVGDGSLGTGASWIWYADSCGGTPIGSGPAISVSPAGTTTYYVRAEGPCDTTACAQKTLTITPLPNGNITGDTAVCLGTAATLTFHFSIGTAPFDVVYTDGATNYTVTGVVDGQTVAVTPALASTYVYVFTSITDANGCVRTTGFNGGATVTASPLPNFQTVTAGNVLCFGGNTGSITIVGTSGLPPYQYSIDGGTTWFSNGGNFTGLIAGTYNLSIKDTLGCSRNYPTPVILTQPTDVTQTDSVVNASCSNVLDGSIIVTAAGGTPPYQYALNFGPQQAGNVLASLGAGTYVVEVVDHNGCIDTNSVTVGNSYIITDSLISKTDVSCFGGSNGTISVVLLGGTPPYTYSDNGSIFQSIGNFTGLTAGNYIITAKDARGCTDYMPVTINQPSALSANVDSIHNVSCNGTATGIIYVTVTGGTGPYTYVWSGSGSTFANDSNLTAGTYTVTITDAHSCSTFASGTVAQPQPIFVNIAGYSDLRCFNDNSGSINLGVSGGTAPYTFLWSNGATTQNVSGLAANTYYVTVTDHNGCTQVDSQTLIQPLQLTASATGTNVTCGGGNDGTVTLTVGGGTTPYTYVWTNGATTQNLTGLSAGTYNVVVTDAHNCAASSAYTVTQPNQFVVSASATPIPCHGDSTGTILLSIVGGTPGYTFLWSDAETTQNISGLPAGPYSVLVTDANGCTQSASATISQPAALVLNGTVTNVQCNGGNSGAIAITVNGGVFPYSYSWTTGATTQNVSGLAGGIDTVVVTDANGCSISASFTVNEPTAIADTISGTNLVCHGDASGTVTLLVGGGTPGYTFLWNNFQFSQNLTGLSGGQYIVIITDAHGCTKRDSIIITEPTAIVATATPTSPLCGGASAGSINLAVSGGTPGYTFLWSDAETTQNITGLPAGPYSVVVTDASSCTASASATITQPAALVINGTVTNVQCNGGNSGAVAITVNGGVFPYSYSWTTGATTQNVSGLSGGIDTVLVTDANGCTATASFTVNEPTALADTLTGTNLVCHGDASGTATLLVGGGTPGYTFFWSNFQFSQNLTGLSGGTYHVIITDAHGCMKTDSIVITEPTAVTATATPTSPLCGGASAGSINLTVGGGTPGYTYLWSDAETTQNIAGLPAGPYSVVVTDASGCTGSASATITQPAALVINGTVTNVQCAGGSSGAIAITVNGGVFPYSYSWTTGATTQNVSGLSGGIDTVLVTDNNGCTATASFTVNEPTALADTLTGTNLVCHGDANGTITMGVGGGTPPYTFLWSNFQFSQNLSGLSGGTYSVIITDAHNCTKRDSIIITEPTAVTATATPTSPLCGGASAGSINLTVGGGTPGYTFLWSDAETTQNIAGLPAGPYSVVVTDANGCTGTASATITQPAAIVINGTVTNVQCAGGSSGAISITVNGGVFPYSYSWTTGATTQNVSGLSGGIDTVLVTDNNGCTATASFTVNEPAPIADTIVGTNVTCHGDANGTATLTVSGGTSPYTFLWSGFQFSQNLTGLSGGTYHVIITDAHGCMKTDSIAIVEPAALVLSTSVVNPLCSSFNTGAVNLTVTGGTGGYSFLWSTTETTQNISGLGAGTYYVTVTDGNGCTAIDSGTVSQSAALQLTSIVTNVSCNGYANGSIDITVSGGVGTYSYLWSTGATTEDVSGLATGPVDVTVTDVGGCSISASWNITEPTSITSTITGADALCHGDSSGSATLVVSGGTGPYTFLWSTFQITQNLSNLGAGTYIVIITDTSGCQHRDSVIIGQPTALTVTATAQSVLCVGSSTGSVSLSASGGTPGYTYLWSDGSTTSSITSQAAGTYYYTVTDANGCSWSDSAIVGTGGALTATGVVKNITCNGGSDGAIDLTVTGGVGTYTYVWSNGATTEDLTGLGTGPESVLVTDGVGCSATAAFTITEPTAITSTVTSTAVICNGDRSGSATIVVAGGVPPYSLLWSTFEATPTVNSLGAGLYYVLVVDSAGCSHRDSVFVTQPAAITVTANVQSVLCQGTSTGSITLNVSGGVPGYTYLWGDGSTTATISSLAAGAYYYTVTDANGCTKADSAVVGAGGALTATGVVTNVLCHGELTGAIDLTVTGGVGTYTYTWSNGATTEDLSGLGAGPESVLVTDGSGCSASAGFNVTEPTALSSTITATNVLCNGQSTGSATVVVSGGVAPYTLLWSTFEASATINNLSANLYYVLITDSNGCSRRDSITITQPAALAVTANIQSVLCLGSATGSVSLTVTGGNGSYTYLWGDGSTTSSISSLLAGTYYYTVTDGNGCTKSDSAVVGAGGALTATGAVTNVTCNGGNNGAVVLTVTGGVQPYTYAWSNGATTQNVLGLSAGPISVDVSDNNGCSTSASFTLTEPTAITSTITPINVTCHGANNGGATTVVSGGVPPYTYLWSNFQITAGLTGQSGGTYIVIITDSVGCQHRDSVIITEPAALQVVATGNSVLCSGSATGSASLTVTGGTPAYSYLWGDGSTTSSISGLTAGTYYYTVTDANGCNVSDSVIVDQSNALAATGVVTNVTCNGGNNGAVNLTVTGGTQPYTYLWSTGATTENIGSQSAGNVSVTVSDNVGCSTSTSFTIIEPTAITSTVTGTDATCYGNADGSATLQVSGGTPPYLFLWSAFQVSQNVNGLSAGTYYVIITDSAGCTHRDSVAIHQPGQLNLTLTPNSVLCTGTSTGGVDLTVTGGTPAYTYLWDNGATTQNLTGVAAGNYSVTVTDSHGCSASGTTTVTQTGALGLTAVIHNVSCFGGNDGAITVTASGGVQPYGYLWTTGATTANIGSLTAGAQTVSVTDNNGCSVSATYTVTQPTVITSTITGHDVSCFGGNDGSATMTVTGGTPPYTFLWSAFQITQNVGQLTASNYFVIITDSAGCAIRDSVTISQPPALVLVATAQSVLCNGTATGGVNLTVSGGTPGYTYLWDNGATTQNLTGVVAGPYNVTVTDSHGCTASATATVGQNGALAVTAVVTGVTCNGGSNGGVDITVTGGTPGYTYLWSTGATTEDIDNQPTGPVTVTVTDAVSCSVTASYNITEPTGIGSTVTATNVTCYGGTDGSASLQVSGGTPPYTFLWSAFQVSQNVGGLNAGTYYVIITDSVGCTHRDSAIVTQPPLLVVTASAQSVLCNGTATGGVNLTVIGGTPGYTYLWDNGATTQNLTGIVAGVYHVTVTDSHGCFTTDSAVVTQSGALAVTGTTTDVTCNGGNNGSVILLVTGGVGPYTYLWSNGATTGSLGGQSAGPLTVTVTDANTCTVSASFTIIQPTAITANKTVTDVNCFGGNDGSANLTVSGGHAPYTFLWSNFQITQNVSSLGAGTYFVIITDSAGCTLRDSVIVNQPDLLVVTANVTPISCSGNGNGAITLTASGGTPGYTYIWNTGETTATISNLIAGTYHVTVTDSHGCFKVDSFLINQPVALTVNFIKTDVRCNGGSDGAISLSVFGGSGPYSFIWSNGATTQNITGLTQGNYDVTVSDINTCSTSLTFTIIEPTPIVDTIVGVNVHPCNGSNNGSATLSPGGGTPPYTYFWSNFQITQDISGLGGGTYFVIITDANGCAKRDSIIITEPVPIFVSLVDTPITCHGAADGKIAAYVTGGNQPFGYVWSNTATGQLITGLAPGTYKVTVTDASSCTVSAQATIIEPPLLTINLLTTNITCHDSANGRITTIPTGGTPGYSYLWSNGDTTRNVGPLAPGPYVVTVTDAKLCTATDTAIVVEPQPLLATGIQFKVTCYGICDGYAITTITGGTPPYYAFWSLDGVVDSGYNALIIQNQCGGAHDQIFISDGNACQASTIYNFNNPQPLVITPLVSNNKCADSCNGRIAPVVTGGTYPYNYLWSTFSHDSLQTGLCAGFYSLVLTDDNNCKAYDTLTLTQPSRINILATVTDADCFGASTGAIKDSVFGGTPGTTGYLFNWSNNATTQNISGVLAGPYQLVVTDSNGCTMGGSYTIGQPTQILTSIISNQPTCHSGSNGSLSVVAQQGSPNYTYLWSNSQTAATTNNIGAGDYTVTVTDAHGCTVSQTYTLDQPDSIAVVTNATNARCFDTNSGQVIATVTGGTQPYNYEINGLVQLTDTFYNLPKGDYTLLVSDVNGCAGTNAFHIGAPDQVQVSLSVANNLNIILTGMETQLVATTVPDTGITAFIWSPITVDSVDIFDYRDCGDSSVCSHPWVHPPFTTMFTVAAVNSSGCIATDTITIFVNTEPVAFIPTAFTPNGDGLNDRFEFNVLGANTIEISIFDRWGEQVYYNANQTNGLTGTDGWDGTKKGTDAPNDTYVYQMKITYFDHTTKDKTGTITIMR